MAEYKFKCWTGDGSEFVRWVYLTDQPGAAGAEAAAKHCAETYFEAETPGERLDVHTQDADGNTSVWSIELPPAQVLEEAPRG